MRGTFTPFDGAKLSYNLGAVPQHARQRHRVHQQRDAGRAFFANIGQTRRQGIDAGLQLKTDRWLAYIAYTYIDATYQSGFVESAGNNPAADANGNITIQRGNRLPGIPANQVKLGVYYKVTDKWTVGATAIGASTAFLFGDEANLTPPLPGYFTHEPQHVIPIDGPHPAVRLGAEHHERAVLHVRHILADQLGVSRAGPWRDQSAQLQPRGADRRLRWRAHLLLMLPLLTVPRPAPPRLPVEAGDIRL